MFSLSILLAFGIVAGVVAYLRFGAPFLRIKGFDYYTEVKLGLMFAGYVFRDDKIKGIADTTLLVVKELEKLSLTSEEKHNIAIENVCNNLLNKFNLVLDDEALSLLIQLAVTILPPTNVN